MADLSIRWGCQLTHEGAIQATARKGTDRAEQDQPSAPPFSLSSPRVAVAVAGPGDVAECESL